MAIKKSEINKFANLVYVGNVVDHMTPQQFVQMCRQIDELPDFINSPVFSHLTFDGFKGIDGMYQEDGSYTLFFHFDWTNKNLQVVKDITIAVYLSEEDDYSNISYEFMYDLDEDEWDIILQRIVVDLRREK